jgi:hypothetical protein
MAQSRAPGRCSSSPVAGSAATESVEISGESEHEMVDQATMRHETHSCVTFAAEISGFVTEIGGQIASMAENLVVTKTYA